MIGDEGFWLLLKSICLSTRDGSVKFVREREREKQQMKILTDLYSKKLLTSKVTLLNVLFQIFHDDNDD